jgi:hypothetical protein
MKSITTALIAIISASVSVSIPTAANALLDRTPFETHVDMYEKMCRMHKYRQPNGAILRFGREYYLQNATFVITSDDDPDRVQMLKRARSTDMASAALEVASVDGLCQ